jgi:hypothetical protein
VAHFSTLQGLPGKITKEVKKWKIKALPLIDIDKNGAILYCCEFLFNGLKYKEGCKL